MYTTEDEHPASQLASQPASLHKNFYPDLTSDDRENNLIVFLCKTFFAHFFVRHSRLLSVKISLKRIDSKVKFLRKMLPAVKRVIGRSPSRKPQWFIRKGLLVRRDRLNILTRKLSLKRISKVRGRCYKRRQRYYHNHLQPKYN